jgi:hypothetical protein
MARRVDDDAITDLATRLGQVLAEQLEADGYPARVQVTVTVKRPSDRRRRLAVERAQWILGKLFPRGVPDQALLPNKMLIRILNEQLKAHGLRAVSDNTVLRAAARKT